MNKIKKDVNMIGSNFRPPNLSRLSSGFAAAPRIPRASLTKRSRPWAAAGYQILPNGSIRLAPGEPPQVQNLIDNFQDMQFQMQ
jgi:hypothetical protein